MADPLLYESPPMTIGKHEWRAVVKPSDVFPGKNSTEYQWRRADLDGHPVELHARREPARPGPRAVAARSIFGSAFRRRAWHLP